MKSIYSRIRRLQHQLCPNGGQEQSIWLTVLFGQEFALDTDRCVEILQECGFVPSMHFLVLYFCGIPDGLNARELEQYLRKNGAQICGGSGNQEHIALGAAVGTGRSSLVSSGADDRR
jgi:hypothetical protein